jgi:predicted permease
MAVELSTSERYRSEVSFLRAMAEEVSAIPGMRAAAITNRLPLGDDHSTRPVNMGAKADAARQEMVEVRRVSPGFFEAMGMRLVRGRLLSEADTPETARVALVNERFARRFLGTADPVGRQLFIQEGLSPAPAVIVGVVNDLRNASMAADPRPEVYLSIFVHPSPNVALVVRGSGSTAALMPEVRRRLARLDPKMPLSAAMPLEALVENSAAPQRSLAYLLSVFSLLAGVLAAVGVYGVSAFAVMGRMGEIGIRMALGAGPVRIVVLVLRRVAAVVAAGMALGVALSVVANRWAQSLMAGIDGPRMTVIGAALLMFLVAAVLASLGPALRAASVDPSIAQRS